MSAASPTANQEQKAIERVAQNLIAGIQLARGRRLSVHDVRVSVGQMLVAFALNWVLIAGAQVLAAGPGANFWIWGFASEAARAYVWITALALVAILSARPGAFVTIATAIAYAALPLQIFTSAVDTAAHGLVDARPDFELEITALFMLWQLAIAWRALQIAGGYSASRFMCATAVYAAMLVVLGTAMPHSAMVYHDYDEAPALDIESVYYRQADLLDQQIERLSYHQPDRIDLYFVGFAAYASQDVFMREVRQARAIFEDKFDLEGKTMALINNPATVAEIPLANRHNLATALHAVAERIDREEDIVFLFVTSHGNRDGSVAVDFEPLGLNDVYAREIRSALDFAGVRWRVIVISACFSGSFIDALKSPTTLIITAAAADRSSFGCAHENYWTYFGRAYFEHALTETGELLAAFDIAAERIAEREDAQGKEPSQPQRWTGALIAEHLARWQQQRTLAQ